MIPRQIEHCMHTFSGLHNKRQARVEVFTGLLSLLLCHRDALDVCVDFYWDILVENCAPAVVGG